MKISGNYTINAPRQAVWDRLTSPEAIASCLPGIQQLDKTGDDEYSMSLDVGIGMVKGTYTGKIRLFNINEPNDYQMQVEGNGRPGFVKGTGTVRLNEDGNGGTQIDYDGDVEVGGPVGSVAQRMLGGVTNRMVGQFFDCIEGQIQDS